MIFLLGYIDNYFTSKGILATKMPTTLGWKWWKDIIYIEKILSTFSIAYKHWFNWSRGSL